MKRILAILASLALIGWLAADARWRELAEIATRLSPATLALGFGGFLASYILRAARVHDEFRHNGQSRLATCLRIVLIHNALVNIVPFRGGEAAFPLLLRKTFGTPTTRAVASLFWFRLQDALIVALIATLVWPGLPLALRLAGVVALLGGAWYLPRWARAPHDWANGHAVAAKLGKLRDAFAESARHARLGWFWTVANWSVKLATQAWILGTLLASDIATGVAGALGAELAAILPIQGVAGFGTYEAGAAAALAPHQIPFELGLQAALALHLFVIASATSAGALAWLLPTPAASARQPDSPAS